jgi:predicted RNA-binding protein with RPS1 domain
MAVGDEVSVYVLSFDKEHRKISLGYKKNEDDPWMRFTTKYAVNDVVSVKIVKMMPFGAFAEIVPGVDGLIHISQITDHRIGLPSEFLSNGQTVEVKITEIDNDRKKVSLSIRALIDPSSQPVSDAEVANAHDDDKAPVIKWVFEQYANGVNKKEIIKALTSKGIYSPKTGKPYGITAFQDALRSRTYIGILERGDIVVEDACPALIDKELFEQVQECMKKNKKAPARHKAEDDYILTTKLYCGDCGAYMVGESGTSRPWQSTTIISA